MSGVTPIQSPAEWLMGTWAVDGRRADTTIQHLTTAVRPLAAALSGRTWAELDRELAARYVKVAADGQVKAASRACERAVADGLLSGSPFDGLVPVWSRTATFRYIDDSDQASLVAALHEIAGHHGGVLESAMMLLRHAPLSVDEVLSLCTDHVDLSRGEIRVSMLPPESSTLPMFEVGAWRTVPLDDRVRTAVEQLSWHPEPLLLTGRYGGALTRRALEHRFRAARVRAGLDDLQFRDFRHSHVADLCAAQVPRQEIRRRLGLSAHWRELIALHRGRLAANAEPPGGVAEQLQFELEGQA